MEIRNRKGKTEIEASKKRIETHVQYASSPSSRFIFTNSFFHLGLVDLLSMSTFVGQFLPAPLHFSSCTPQCNAKTIISLLFFKNPKIHKKTHTTLSSSVFFWTMQFSKTMQFSNFTEWEIRIYFFAFWIGKSINILN